MFELNANFVVMTFAFTGGLGAYFNARRSGMPIAPSLKRAVSMTAVLAVLNILWALALTGMQLRWNSVAGYGLGLAIGFVGLLAFFTFNSFRNRRKRWR